jgi:DNA helicase IV
MWPRLSPHELLHDLFGAPALLRAAGEGVLNEDERALLERDRSSSLDEVSWTSGDAALVDELRVLLGPRRQATPRRRTERREDAWPQGLDGGEPERRERADEEVRSFGHIVVDEIQDLSPMQLRMLARRSLSGSMTVVGDIAQATGPWAPGGWDEVAAHLTPKRAPKIVELTVSYRTPAEVIELSRRVLEASGTGLAPPRPVRVAGSAPTLDEVAAHDLASAVVAAAIEERGLVAPGHVAVLAPRAMLATIRRAFDEAGQAIVDPRAYGGPGLSADLVLLAVDEANGLEFDGVVVVEPAEIAARGADASVERPGATTTRGLRTLYVAMTRPTTRLRIVGSRPFPVSLRA